MRRVFITGREQEALRTLQATSLKRIEAAQCEKILDELVESGPYVDSDTVIRAKHKLRSNITKRKDENGD